MNLFSIQQKFNTKSKCIRHLEDVRWKGEPLCPICNISNVTPRKKRKFFYHCNKCNKDFTVLKGTIFEASKLPLPKWFMLIGIMLNARKGVSSMELHRHLGVTYKSAWYSAMRVRCAMIDEIDLLEGIVEMDEVYVGGKPKKRNQSTADNVPNISTLKSKRGKGTKKTPVVGIVEREGKKRVAVQLVEKSQLNSKDMLAMLKKYVNTEKAIAMTDESTIYNKFENELQHLFVTHGKGEYARGIVHTNTIDGFWSIIKNGIRGEYHALSKKYLPFYLAEWSYKYNRRSKPQKSEAFEETIGNAVSDDKCLVNYKPKGAVQKIAYGEEIREKTPKKPKRKYRRLKAKKPMKKKRVFKKSVKGKRTKNVSKKLVKKKIGKKKSVKNVKIKTASKKRIKKKRSKAKSIKKTKRKTVKPKKKVKKSTA